MQGLAFGGYVYELSGVANECWLDCSDEFWDVAMAAHPGKSATRELGVRRIDDVSCMVFECADGKVRAVTMTAAKARQRRG